jgi:hypothetical protein
VPSLPGKHARSGRAQEIFRSAPAAWVRCWAPLSGPALGLFPIMLLAQSAKPRGFGGSEVVKKTVLTRMVELRT